VAMSTFTEGVLAIGTVGAAYTISIAKATVLTATLTASVKTAFTMPPATAGKSFTLFLRQAAVTGGGDAEFLSVKWAGSAPTPTTTAGRLDVFIFIADGTNWYGSTLQNFEP
jgi:hypothetical protein